jgi:hypothetical protein
MSGAPGLDSADVLGAAKVVLVLRFAQPGPPACRFALLPARRRGTVFLAFRVPRIGVEEHPTKQTLVVLCPRHDPPSLRTPTPRNDALSRQLSADLQGKKTKKQEDRKATKKTQEIPSDRFHQKRSTKKIHVVQTAMFRRLSERR